MHIKSLLFAIAVLAVCHTASAEDWPQVHGPLRDNKSTETGLMKKWPKGGPETVWTARGIGNGYAGAAIVDGRLYTAGDINGKTVVSALNDQTGKIIWQTENGRHTQVSIPMRGWCRPITTACSISSMTTAPLILSRPPRTDSSRLAGSNYPTGKARTTGRTRSYATAVCTCAMMTGSTSTTSARNNTQAHTGGWT
jgi:outer membrane protein assembly factor BamB